MNELTQVLQEASPMLPIQKVASTSCKNWIEEHPIESFLTIHGFQRKLIEHISTSHNLPSITTFWDSPNRSHYKIYCDRHTVVYFLAFPEGTFTEEFGFMHDHGKAYGSFNVIEGDLYEQYWSDPDTIETAHKTGTIRSMSPSIIHRIGGMDGPVKTMNVYSRPPLSKQNVYRFDTGYPVLDHVKVDPDLL